MNGPTDTFTDAKGAHYIASYPVASAVWERYESLATAYQALVTAVWIAEPWLEYAAKKKPRTNASRALQNLRRAVEAAH